MKPMENNNHSQEEKTSELDKVPILNENGDIDEANHMQTRPQPRPSSSKLTVEQVIQIKMYAHGIKKKIEYRKAARRVVFPTSRPKICWDLLNFTLLIYSAFEVPYSLAFESASCDHTWHEYFNLVIDSVFMCDLAINFVTAYFDEESGRFELRYPAIAFRYIKGWFVFDLGSSLPLNQIVCAAIGNGESNGAIVRLIKIFRIIKVFRILRMVRLAAKLQDANGSLGSKAVRLLKFFGFLLLGGHTAACLWYYSIDINDCSIPAGPLPVGPVICGCEEGQSCQPYNWFVRYDNAVYTGNSTSARYSVAVYYAIVTLATLGYGDVLPTNGAERALSSALALVGAVMFSFLIGNINGLVSKGNAVAVAADEELAALRDLASLKRAPFELSAAARKSAAHRHARAPHRIIAALDALPRPLRSELVEHVARDSLGGLFDAMSADGRARLAAVLRPCALPPGQYVFRALDVATELYWVVKGEVDLLSLDGDPVGRNGPGAMVGLIELFPELRLFSEREAPFRLRSARARTPCELLELRDADLRGTVRAQFPDLYRAIRHYAQHKAREIDVSGARAAMRAHEEERCAPLRDLALRSAKISRARRRLSASSLPPMPTQAQPAPSPPLATASQGASDPRSKARSAARLGNRVRPYSASEAEALVATGEGGAERAGPAAGSGSAGWNGGGGGRAAASRSRLVRAAPSSLSSLSSGEDGSSSLHGGGGDGGGGGGGGGLPGESDSVVPFEDDLEEWWSGKGDAPAGSAAGDEREGGRFGLVTWEHNGHAGAPAAAVRPGRAGPGGGGSGEAGARPGPAEWPGVTGRLEAVERRLAGAEAAQGRLVEEIFGLRMLVGRAVSLLEDLVPPQGAGGGRAPRRAAAARGGEAPLALSQPCRPPRPVTAEGATRQRRPSITSREGES